MKKFTLIELLVVIAIIGILASILIPSLQRARAMSKRAVCLSNQKQMSTAWMMYAADDSGYMLYPKQANHWATDNDNWARNLTREILNDNKVFFKCPSTEKTGWKSPGANEPGITYIYNAGTRSGSNKRQMAEIVNPTKKVIFWELGYKTHYAVTANYNNGANGFPRNNPDWIVPHVDLTYALGFADGHSEAVKYSVATANQRKYADLYYEE